MNLDTSGAPNPACENSMTKCFEGCRKARNYYGPVAQTFVEDFTPVGPVIEVLRPIGNLIYVGSVAVADKFDINLSRVFSVKEWLLR